jgi:hypothetical protein
MGEQRHMPVRIRRIKGKEPGDHYFCEVCGVRWPCLAASEAAIQRMREQTPNVPPGGGPPTARRGYYGTSPSGLNPSQQ